MKPYKNKGSVLPTFLPFESSTQDPEDEDVSEENESRVELKQTGETELKVSVGGEDNTPLLLSEKALTELLQDSEEVEDLVEDDDNPGEREDVKETEMKSKDVESTNENIDKEDKNEGGDKEDDGTDIDSSTDSEIPMDLDASQPLPIKLKDAKASTMNTQDKEMEKMEDVIPTAMDYDSQQSSSSEASKDNILEKQSELNMPAEIQQPQDELTEPLHDAENDKIRMKPGENDQRDLQDGKDFIPTSGKKAKKEKKQKYESGHGKGKGKKKQKKQNVEEMQNDQAGTFEAKKEHTQKEDQEKQLDPTENLVPKTRKKNGKWV